MLPRRAAYRIVAIYAILSALWILFSDRLLVFLAEDPTTLTILQTFKGWFFVVATSILLYLFILRTLQRHEKSEQALQESESRFKELVENATYGIFRSTADGAFLDVNMALARMLGYESKDDLKSRKLFQDILHQPSEGAAVGDQILRAGRIERAELQWKKKDGTLITVLLSGRGSHREGEQSPIFEGIVEDVTERRALEKRNQLLQKFEAIGQLAGGIAHDFNNVLGTIIGYADLALQRSPQDQQIRRYLEVVQDQGRRGAGLTRQLLAFARRQILEPRNIDVNQVVEERLRAFLLAGSRTVVASLWSADDTFTAALVKQFYANLKKGQDKGLALRGAKIELLKKYGDQALPYYWAGFVMVGEGAGHLSLPK